jgi:hypothetical protein
MERIDRVLNRLIYWISDLLESAQGKRPAGPCVNEYYPGNEVSRHQNSASIRKLNRFAKESKRAKGGKLKM